MKLSEWRVFCFLIFIFVPIVKAEKPTVTYSERLCADFLNYQCYIVKTEKWENFFPDAELRDLIQRINRQNTVLVPGQKIAIPRQITGRSYLDLAPFPQSVCYYDFDKEVCFLAKGDAVEYSEVKEKNDWLMPCIQGKTIIFDPHHLAFAAYNQEGELVYWGPAVGGQKFCPDIKKPCQTPQGNFQVVYKTGANYHSKTYPVGCRGKECAPMPYAVFFENGAAFHAGLLPGRNASHGCVRLFLKDAQWLNEFAEIGTKVIIRPY